MAVKRKYQILLKSFKNLAEKKSVRPDGRTLPCLNVFSLRFHGKETCRFESQFLLTFMLKSSLTYMCAVADSVSLALQVGPLRFSVPIITISIVFRSYIF
jgi:hypothetical protein